MTVQTHLADKILHLCINRPERKNALNLETYQGLADGVKEGASNPDVKVILISGAEGVFTAGNDLGDFATHRGQLSEDENPTPKFMQAMMDCDKPIVAAVQGPAVGIGTTMLLHCDFVYADDTAFFQLPFVTLGLCPEFASSVLMPRMMGHPKAAELLYFAERFDGNTAKDVGIVNDVVADVLAHAKERCTRLTQLPASALRATKALLKQDVRDEFQKVRVREIEAFTKGLQSPEFIEAVTAFGGKRAPDFSKFD